MTITIVIENNHFVYSFPSFLFPFPAFFFFNLSSISYPIDSFVSQPDRWKNLKTSKSTKPAARRGVTFNEDIQTIPITSRMDRLRRLLEDEAEEQRQQTASIRDVYAEQLQDIQKQQQQERKEMTKKKVQVNIKTTYLLYTASASLF